MREALEFAVRVLLKHAIWIAGAAWLFAVGSWMVFVRRDGGPKSGEDSAERAGRKIIIGAAVLAIGILIAL